MTVDFSGGWVTYRPKCNEPPEALCRARWDCECEVWDSSGVNQQGPWHEISGELFSPSVRHYGKPGGDCGFVASIEDIPDELGEGEVTFAIEEVWLDGGCTWRVAP